MKTLKIIIVAMFFAFASFRTVHAQSDKTKREIGIKTEQIEVSGKCGMDKNRIESAAYSIDSIKAANWNENTQLLTLKYRVFKKDASDKALKEIALAGNDTEKYAATDGVYGKLPVLPICKKSEKVKIVTPKAMRASAGPHSFKI